MVVSPERPADVCPSPKPFPKDFDECPAYQAMEFVALDTSYTPLSPVWTWVAALRQSRLEKIRELQRQMAEASRTLVLRIWELKGQQLRTLETGSDERDVTSQLEAARNRYLVEAEAFLEDHDDLLRSVDMPLNACMALLRSALDDFVAHLLSAAAWRHAGRRQLELPGRAGTEAVKRD